MVDRQLDLADLWRTRRWRKLLNIIDGLPSNSHFVEAYADDDDMADAIVRHSPDAQPVGPRLSQWTPERAELAEISDRLGALLRALTGSSTAIPARPRPRTAVDRARERWRLDVHERLVARLLPGRASDIS